MADLLELPEGPVIGPSDFWATADAPSNEQLRPWLQLLFADGIGNSSALKLLAAFGEAEQVLAQPNNRWQGLGLRKAATAAAADDPRIVSNLAFLAQPGVQALPITHPAYPPALRQAQNPPILLFVRGTASVLAAAQVAIVGARAATPQGLENAHAFGRSLAERGVVVTSGLALGVDGAAHQGALDGSGATIAVCGTGLDRVYPARHKALAHAIVAGRGALTSDFTNRTGARAQQFPQRNRLLAAISLGTVVVEAGLESGSLLTARLAAEIGREVFAIPGSIHNPLARGCHRLIRDGAKLVESVDDILLELQPALRSWLQQQASAPASTPERGQPSPPPLSPTAACVYAALTDAPQAIDQLIARSGLSAEQVNTELLMLELAGLAANHQGNFLRLHAS